MAINSEGYSIWDEIDRAENYLVCCMFDDAISLATLILRRNQTRSKIFYDSELDLVESAGMILVQSMKQSHRTSAIMKELKVLFGSVTAIPVQVFITGICLQMSECPLNTVEGFLKEYLNNWRYEDDRYYPLSGAEATVTESEGSCFKFYIGVDEYLEVIELYVVTLLVKSRKDIDLAISWVEKAMLPEEKRQELLRRLRSLSSSKANNLSHASISPQIPEDYRSDFSRNQKPNGVLKDIESEHLPHRANTTAKDEILKMTRQRSPSFLWFPTISLKLGNLRLNVPAGKMLLASLLLLTFYFTRNKHAALKRVVIEKAVSLKRALVDLWQLAFSYQVNPLAAVQPLPTATHGSR